MAPPSGQIFWLAAAYREWRENYYTKYFAVMKLYHLHHRSNLMEITIET